MSQFELTKANILANEELGVSLSAPLYPSQTTEFPKVKFCTAAPGHPCVCTAGSIARIRSECLTCGSVSDLDRRLMAYEIMAHPDVIL